MIILGLTGSIAMGKTTTASMFAKRGAAIYDADAGVHVLYRAGGAAGAKLRPHLPEAVDADGSVRRDVLKRLLAEDASRLSVLESEVLPLLSTQRKAFLSAALAEGRELAVLDIPLLYETGADSTVDAVVLATASSAVQRARALSRNTMDEATFDLLVARQMPDEEKRRRADFVVRTDDGLEAADRQVHRIIDTVLEPGWTPGQTRSLATPAGATDIKLPSAGERG